jgi:hypothetical protein
MFINQSIGGSEDFVGFGLAVIAKFGSWLVFGLLFNAFVENLFLLLIYIHFLLGFLANNMNNYSFPFKFFFGIFCFFFI